MNKKFDVYIEVEEDGSATINITESETRHSASYIYDVKVNRNELVSKIGLEFLCWIDFMRGQMSVF